MRKMLDRIWRWIWVPTFDDQMSPSWLRDRLYESGKQ